MTQLKHHPNSFLNAAAAADFDRAEDERGVLNLNEAGRTVATQQALINRWNAGGAANRPPYLYKPAMPATTSNHVVNGGQAVDIANYNTFSAYCQQYGFVHSFPGSDPVHFDHFGVNPTTGHVNANDTIRDQQNFLASRGYNIGPTGADGIAGSYYKAAVKSYQSYLKQNYGYAGAIDGIWGAGTQTAHAKYVAALNAVIPPAPTAGNHTGTVADLGTLSDVRGLQKIAKLNGGNTGIDNRWGPESAKGMQNFLNAAYGGSLATWLRTKWGYKDADNIWGPNMKAAAARADAANYTALK